MTNTRGGALRELHEETGLEATPGALTLFETAAYERADDEHVLLVLYTVPRSVIDGDVVTTEEASAAGFFSPAEFTRSGGSMIPPVRRLFERAAHERP